MSSFRKDSFELADYFNANSERMLRLSIAAGTFLAGQFQKQQRDADEEEMLQSIYNIGQAAATFDRHYHDTTDVAAMARRESEEFTYSWGYGFNDRHVDSMSSADAFRGAVRHPDSPGLKRDFITQCGVYISRRFQPGPYAMVEFLHERIVGSPYDEECALPTPRHAEIHAEVERIFRELWYRIEYKSFWLEHRSIEAIQREYQVQLLKDERTQVWLKDFRQRTNYTPPYEKDVETKLRELRTDRFYRYPEPKCYLEADIVGSDYRQSAIYGSTRFLLKFLLESLIYGGVCLNVTNEGDASGMDHDAKRFYKLLNESAQQLSAYAKTATELFFPTIAIETAKSAYGGSPIRSDARKAIESSNSSLAIVAKEIHDALSVRGNAE
ncbi:hypothetical protein AAVH_16761 [Aphelenchoides avenae]|nr:hypothetical protein AAVH_16761 [Aphelenchus avenae]